MLHVTCARTHTLTRGMRSLSSHKQPCVLIHMKQFINFLYQKRKNITYWMCASHDVCIFPFLERNFTTSEDMFVHMFACGYALNAYLCMHTGIYVQTHRHSQEKLLNCLEGPCFFFFSANVLHIVTTFVWFSGSTTRGLKVRLPLNWRWKGELLSFVRLLSCLYLW